MAITLRGHAKPQASGSTGSTASVPSTVIANSATGDVIIACFYVDQNNVTVTPPTGWTQIDDLNNSAGGPYNMHTYWHAYTASEPANWTWTLGSSVFWDVELISFIGCDPTTEPDVHSIINSATATSITTNNADAVVLFNINFSGFNIAASGFTIVENNDGLGLGYLIQSAAGSQGATVTGGSGGETTNLIGLSPAGAGGGGTAHTQTVTDSHSALESQFREPTALKLDAHSATELRSNQPQKNLPDEFFSERDTKMLGLGKGLFDFHSARDVLLPKAVTKNLLDAHSALDALAKMPAKTFIEAFSELDSATHQLFSGVLWTRTVTDAHSARDVVTKLATKFNADAWSAIDSISRAWIAHLLIQEFVSLTETTLKAVSRTQADAFSETDSKALQTAKHLLESVSAQDLLNRAITKAQLDSTSGFDTTMKQVQHTLIDHLSQTDRVSVARGLLLTVLDALSLTDQVVRIQDLRPGNRFPLVVAASLVASAFGINVTFASTPDLAVTPTLLPDPLLVTPTLEAD